LKQLTESELKTIRKILVIQLGPFGDALLTTSYFETLKRRLPGVRLYYLVKDPYDLAIRNHPLIDRIMLIKNRSGLGYALERLRTVWRIRRERFDLVIDQQLKPSSQQLTLLSGARYRLGYKEARMSWAYNLKAEPHGLRYSGSCRFDILGPLGIEEEPYSLYFHIPDEARDYVDAWLKNVGLCSGEFVCISPGSPVDRKKWNLGSYAKLADMVQSGTGRRVVLLWGPDEKADVDAVSSRMDTEPVLAPPTDLRQAAALLKRCELLVCNDGGLNHISAATGTRTLAIFGDTDPEHWSPASVFPTHLHLHVPGFDSPRDDSFGISPETAFEEVRTILEGQGSKNE
jgi:ADP-heptose:LPS heptosyltransferase